MNHRKSFNILIADDDADDQQLMKEGLDNCPLDVEIDCVNDGVQMIDYLLKRGPYKQLKHLPDLILLDLNMLLMDGFDVLNEVKKHSSLKPIPIYVITTSRNIDHLNRALELGANGFYTKGAKSKDILRIMQEVCANCFESTTK